MHCFVWRATNCMPTRSSARGPVLFALALRGAFEQGLSHVRHFGASLLISPPDDGAVASAFLATTFKRLRTRPQRMWPQLQPPEMRVQPQPSGCPCGLKSEPRVVGQFVVRVAFPSMVLPWALAISASRPCGVRWTWPVN